MTRLSYGPNKQHVLDLTLPAGPGPHPVALLLHGGFWRARYTRGLMRPLAEDLVRRGWAAANVEYRRVGTFRGGGGGWPATGSDVVAAYAHLGLSGAPLDLDRVVPIGHSAGGHLALWLAGRVHCAGVVAQSAVWDLPRAARLDLGAGIVRRFCGGTPEEVPEAYEDATPSPEDPSLPPQLLVHGEDDDIVPASFSEDWAARGTGDVQVDLRPGEGHFEHLDPASGAWETVTTWLTRLHP